MQNKTSKSLLGADINEYTQNVNFDLLVKSIKFLYLRTSGSATGKFRVDTKFLEFAKTSRQYKLPVGGYHYAVPSNDLTTADSQCDDFIRTLEQGFGTKNYGDLFPVVDVEAPINKSISTATLISWIERFRKRFEQKTRRRLMLYTGAFFIDIYDNFKVGNKFPLSTMPLWIAMYLGMPDNPPYPKDQGGWTRWRIWQYTEKGVIPGSSPPNDLNWGPDNIDLLIQPAKVSGLKAYKADGNIYVKWNKNIDIDLQGYNLFLNGNYVKTFDKNATSAVISIYKFDKYIPAGVPYEVSIEAFDNDSETSQVRARVTVARGDSRMDDIRTIKGIIKSTKIGQTFIVPFWRKIRKVIK